MLMLLMALYAAGNLLSAAARLRHADPGRFIAGIPHGAYFGVAALVAAAMAVPDNRAGGVARAAGADHRQRLWRAAGNLAEPGLRLALDLPRGGPAGRDHGRDGEPLRALIAAGNASPRRELGVFRRLQVG
jgi:DHA1 family inner membrane transport protein